ncbi:MAG: oxidoreductase, partial [Deltaproteobacteria bacterium]
MNTRSALLVGASGLTGGHCLRFLLESDLYDKVTVLGRTPLSLEHIKLQQHAIDFDNLEKHSGLITATDIFCCLGTTMKQAGSKDAFYRVDCTYPSEIARIAVGNGSERYLIVTAIGANSKSLFFYNRVKGDVENSVSKLPFRGIYIFRPSILLGNRKESRRGEEIGMSLSKIVSPF